MSTCPQATTPPATSAPNWGSARGEPGAPRTIEAHDADEHAHNLTAWEQHYDQLSAGAFVGRLTELHLPHMQVFREGTSQALRQSCRVWSDAFWFGVPDLASPQPAPTRINGRLHGAHDIMVRPGDQPFELLTPDQHSLLGIVVQREALVQAAQQQGCRVDWHALQEAEVLHVRDAARLDCVQTLDALLRQPMLATQPTPGPAMAQLAMQARQAQQEAVLSTVLAMLDTSEIDASARHSLARRHKVVEQARAHVLAHPDQAVTVPELCAQLHVSRRTLQYCFEEVIGLSPVQYLRAIRLNGVRRQLRELRELRELRDLVQGSQRASGAHAATGVQDVAAHWGFWHLSQFASDYRKLFGQTPSATLRARASAPTDRAVH
jgi:AraC family ethanolamine operon transcriptional activator